MKRYAALFAGLLLAAAPAAAQAQAPVRFGPSPLGPDRVALNWSDQGDARTGVRAGRLVPLSTVIEEIRRRTPGRPLDAGSEYMGDRPVYRVRWITTDGRRIDYLIDASTGAILSGG